MGKTTNSSYKKLRKMEKSKVKIKTSKTFLPKGQNVTDTNFKVKKIIIKDQVRQHEENEILSKKKLSCKELLSRLTHHNSAMKQDSLLLLKQLVTDYPEDILQSNLASLIDAVPKLILDESREVRKDANKLLSVILSQSVEGKLVPMFPVLSSYLVCGLTHIDSSIREDSLHFLDSLLERAPRLLRTTPLQLLQICLDLFSSSGSSAGSSRTLALNLESRQASGQWRGNVLARISRLLSIILESRKEMVEHEIKSERKNVKKFNECFSEYGKTYIPVNLSLVNYDLDTNRVSINSSSSSVESSSLKDYIDELIPLLFQAFVEMVPLDDDVFSDKTSTVISGEVSCVLKYILDIISSSLELLPVSEMDSFKSRFGKSLMSSLVTGRFPYTASPPTDSGSNYNKKKKRSTIWNEEFATSCHLQNIMLTKLVLLLSDPSSWNSAISYLKNSFRNSDRLSPGECSLLISCCKIIVSRAGSDKKVFLEKLNKLCRSSNRELATQAIAALYSFAIDTNLSELHEDVCFQSWLAYLPQLLTEPLLSPQTLGIISDLARRNFPAFSNALDGEIECILDKIPELRVEGGVISDEEGQIKVAQLLYWVKDWDEEMTFSLRKGIESNYWGLLVTSHIKDVLELKGLLSKSKDVSEELKDSTELKDISE